MLQWKRKREREKGREKKWNEDIGKKAEKMRDKEIEVNERIPCELTSAFRCLILVVFARVMAQPLWNRTISFIPEPESLLFSPPMVPTPHFIHGCSRNWFLFIPPPMSLQSYTDPVSTGPVLLPRLNHNTNHLQLVTESADATWNHPFIKVTTQKARHCSGISKKKTQLSRGRVRMNEQFADGSEIKKWINAFLMFMQNWFCIARQ